MDKENKKFSIFPVNYHHTISFNLQLFTLLLILFRKVRLEVIEMFVWSCILKNILNYMNRAQGVSFCGRRNYEPIMKYRNLKITYVTSGSHSCSNRFIIPTKLNFLEAETVLSFVFFISQPCTVHADINKWTHVCTYLLGCICFYVRYVSDSFKHTYVNHVITSYVETILALVSDISLFVAFSILCEFQGESKGMSF